MHKLDLYYMLRIWGVKPRLALRFAFHFGHLGFRMSTNNFVEICRTLNPCGEWCKQYYYLTPLPRTR